MDHRNISAPWVDKVLASESKNNFFKVVNKTAVR